MKKSKSEVIAQELLSKAGLKITKARSYILGFLVEQKHPITIEKIIETVVPHANMVTVYRTLETLAEKDIISQTSFRDGKTYFEYQTTHHHHLVCNNCGLKEEVRHCVEQAVPKILRTSKKFSSINDHLLEFFGTCNECAT